jgi:hypothetical protein
MVAKEIFLVLDFHLDSCLKKARSSICLSMTSCVESLKSVVTQISSDLEMSMDENTISKASIQRKFASVKPSIDSVIAKFFEALSDFFTAVKPIVDVHLVSYLGKKNPIKLLLVRFLSEITSVSRSLIFDSRFYTGHCDIFSQETSSNESPTDVAINAVDDLEQSLFILLTATTFNKIAELSFSKLEIILRESDFDSKSISIEDKESFSQSFRNMSDVAAIAFVELRSSMAISVLSHVFSDASTKENADLAITERAFDICKILSDSALFTSLVFNEPLPVVKALPTETRRAGRQSVVNRYNVIFNTFLFSWNYYTPNSYPIDFLQ